MTKIYSAKWVMPVASAPFEDGAVAIEGERIVAVGESEALHEEFPEAAREDFGEAVIMPGLVNCHTHLELTAMRGYLEREERDFFAWLKKLTIARLERMTPDDLYVSAAWGAIEAARAGVTSFGDASDAASASMRAIRDAGLRGIVYQESFGVDAKLAREHFEKLREKVSLLREFENERVRVGVSPHAPYTVSAPQLELISAYAIDESLPLMMHAAESEAEDLLLREGRGAFAESFARRGIEWHAPGVSTIQYLKRHGVLNARPLLAHCIRVDEDDLETLSAADARVAHCPKSNAKLGHGRAPFKSFLKHDIKVGLGSDSVASNNLCDLLEEARFAVLLARTGRDSFAELNLLSAEAALRAATMGGAQALGWENQVGSLAAGMQADLAIVSLKGSHQQPVHNLAAALVFASSGRDVRLTMVAGAEVYRDGRMLTLDEERLNERMKEIGRKVMSDE
ncbi:MAG: amidohydrolase family protein [Acidobacteria bacterium]|nr:amidohydrolase family protein [Acidobacteriota bacterium]